MAGFNCFSPEALGFLEGLKANNTREWFAANKTIYERHLKEPGKQFAGDVATALHGLTGQSHSSKIFRTHRDVRFSKDKTPYNAHLHIAFTPEGQAGQPPMWFFGLSPGKLSLGCGVFQYDKTALAAFRTAMAGPQGAELLKLTAELQGAGIWVSEPDLKRVPSGFDKDHPNQDALRRKGYSAWIDRADHESVIRPDLVRRSIDDFRRLLPVYRLLSPVE